MEANRTKAAVLTAQRPVSATIRSVRLRGLFGLYDYDIPSANGLLGKLAILYGENGLGKTNVLKIIFHLLSPANNRGHRTAVGKIKFQSIEIELSSDILVTAKRPPETVSGPFRAEIRQNVGAASTLLGGWEWAPEGQPREVPTKFPSQDSINRILSDPSLKVRDRNRLVQTALFEFFQREASPLEGEEAFLKALAQHVPPLFYLSADRIFSADQIDASPVYDAELRAGSSLRTEVLLTKGRERALNDAINSASRQLSRMAVGRSRQSSTSMHAIYQGLIRRLASKAVSTATVRSRSIASLKQDLEALAAEYAKFEQYGLTAELNFAALVVQLEKVRKHERSMASEVLTPYVESLTEQANTLRPAYLVIDGLISTINQFLYDKTASFNLGEGILVKNRAGELLEPKDLSSGEQQLLLLFCNIVMVYESGGVFIVDEPEISLNIKWQRTLVDGLLRLDRAGTLQFLLASHSMELITTHRDSVVPLRDKTNG